MRRTSIFGLFAASPTLETAIAAYLAGDRWARLKPTSRRCYGFAIDAIRAWARTDQLTRLDQLDRAAVRRFAAYLADKPGMADFAGAVLRSILAHALDLALIDVNPAAGQRFARPPPRRRTWSDDELASVTATALDRGRPSIALAVWLAIDTAQRLGDLLALSWRDIGRNQVITLEQQKTGQLVMIPLTDRLASLLPHPELHDQAAPIVATDHGRRRYTTDHFRATFAQLRTAAALDPQLQFRDLRRSCVVRLAEAGATVPEIAAVTGHRIDTTTAIMETYLPRSAAMAQAAITRLDAARRTTPPPRPPPRSPTTHHRFASVNGGPPLAANDG